MLLPGTENVTARHWTRHYHELTMSLPGIHIVVAEVSWSANVAIRMDHVYNLRPNALSVIYIFICKMDITNNIVVV